MCALCLKSPLIGGFYLGFPEFQNRNKRNRRIENLQKENLFPEFHKTTPTT
jgi:hypothetical protein